jgi:Terminase small subunit
MARPALCEVNPGHCSGFYFVVKLAPATLKLARDTSISRSRARISAWRGARSRPRKIRVTSQPPHGFEAEPTEPPPGGVRPRHRRGPLPAGHLQARRLTPASDSVADVNASRLLRHAQVQSRVRELQAAQAQASQITAERLLAELEQARRIALSSARRARRLRRRWAGRSSAVCSSTAARMSRGDRREIRTRPPKLRSRSGCARSRLQRVIDRRALLRALRGGGIYHSSLYA